jgi:hypothetical protein
VIKRVWHGWTSPGQQADAYERLLYDEVFPSIEAQQISGYRKIELLHRSLGPEDEFVTVMSFDSLDGVVAFQGPDYERCYVPEAARRVLKRWDPRSAHFQLLAERRY